jgi:LysM repeat protein
MGDSSYFSPSGLIALDNAPTHLDMIDVPPASDTAIETPEQADHKKSPEIMRYTVKTGDTLAKISDTYNVSIDAIRWANDITLDTLKVGTIIKVPPTSGVIHIVKKGDTLGGIAAKYDIAARDIASFNQLSDRDSLRIGKELMIPGAQKNAPIATLLKTTPVVNPRVVTPIPQDKPTPRPITVDASGLKSSYAIAYTGKGRGFV